MNFVMEDQTSSKTKPKYRGWLTIRRSKPKNKYHLQNGKARDTILPYVPSSEEKEEDIPTLLRRLKIIEETEAYHDQHELVATQRHLIEVLKKENGALRLLRTQIESLRLENYHLRSDHESHKKDDTAGVNGDIDGGGTGDAKHGPKNNGDARQIDNGADGVNEPMMNGHTREAEMEKLRKDNKELRERLGVQGSDQKGQDAPVGNRGIEGSKVNGARDAVGKAGGKLRKEQAGGPGPSGTSLVTVSCLLKCKGKFYDCDETMAARLKSYMATKCVDLVLKDWQEGTDSNQITLVLCHATSSHPLVDIRKALVGVSSDAEIILMVYHTVSMSSNEKDPQTDSLDLPHNNICLVVDIFFSRNEGLYRCAQNDRAMSRIYRLFDILC